ncbi:serine/threonine-protein kinase [Phycicoccus endophyticus]|nr:serine/threonine-protein kinase [Phycicoccus endophyticus]
MNRLAQGYCLGGRYTLSERVASGGMGDVWSAEDTVLDRQVAVKVLRPTTDGEPVFARRFRDEALYTANLCHSNIATVFDYGEEDALAYIVMELVDGEPLSELVRREGPLEPARVRSLMGQAALALGAAHDAGVVHRDVKPANILIASDGTVKLTDFGIARALDGAGHTQTGEVVGTPHYLSPEQALGEVATGASDLYALGIVAHEMLTGRRPFEKNTPVATALAQVNDPPPPLPGHVPPGLRALVEQCLSKRPEDRPASARELGERLGLPESELVGDDPAAEVVGAALVDEEGPEVAASTRASDAGAASDPTPTLSSLDAPLVRVRRRDVQRRRAQAAARRVHWAWAPTALVLAVITVVLALGR